MVVILCAVGNETGIGKVKHPGLSLSEWTVTVAEGEHKKII